MSDELSQLVDPHKEKEVKLKRERQHWNLLIDAKKHPEKVRQAMLAGIFQEFIESSLFFETTTHLDALLAKYHMAVIRVFGKAFTDLIPLLELKSSYDQHMEYMGSIKSKFFTLDKELFKSVPQPTERLSIESVKQRLNSLTTEEVAKKRIAVALGTKVSLELMNCKEFVEVFQPTEDVGHAMRGRLGSLLVNDEPCIPVVTDCMRREEDKALDTDAFYWCENFQANVKVRHNNTWDSVNIKVENVQGATAYVYTGTTLLN